MSDLNIPLFRAEIIEDKRDEDYKKGFTIEVNNVKYAIGNYSKGLIEVEVDGQTRFFPIKKNTLSINFNDMTDSQGNKIFASLQENGKGGSIANYDNKGNWIAMYIENAFMWVNVKDMQKIEIKEPVSFLRLKPLAKIVVIGIQK